MFFTRHKATAVICRIVTFVGLIGWEGTSVCPAASADPPGEFIHWRHGSKQVGAYRFQVDSSHPAPTHAPPVSILPKCRTTKPHFPILSTVDGQNILLDSPADHIHHHGLMYAVAIDGLTFWGEEGEFGWQRHRQFNAPVPQSIVHGETMSFEEILDWIGPDSTKPLAMERRQIATRADRNARTVFVDWTTELTAPPDKDIEISGSHYYGLGMRFIPEFNGRGHFEARDGSEGTVFRGDERLWSSDWIAYHLPDEGDGLTIVLYDRPGNPRPATWFTMKEPFAYMSATLAFHEKAIHVKTGKTLRSSYRIAVISGPWRRSRIEQLYADFLKNKAAHAPQLDPLVSGHTT